MPDQPTPAPLPSLAEFWERCARHDYRYLGLDDPHALRRAAAVDAELRVISGQSKEHRDIFWGFYDAAHIRGAKRPARPVEESRPASTKHTGPKRRKRAADSVSTAVRIAADEVPQ